MSLPIQTGTDNPTLRKKSEPIKHITKDIKKLVKEMEVSMKESQGIGLAAPQIGQNIRLILITLFRDGGSSKGRKENIAEKILPMINPEITAYSMEKETAEEGCLSVPGFYDDVERYKEVEVKFLNLDGREMKLRLSGLNAREVQHEIDHLDGVLFTDLIEPEKVPVKKTSERKMEKTQE